jgi:hypothetical protein
MYVDTQPTKRASLKDRAGPKSAPKPGPPPSLGGHPQYLGSTRWSFHTAGAGFQVPEIMETIGDYRTPLVKNSGPWTLPLAKL